MPDHARKYNVPEASEVAALIVGEQHGKLDIEVRHRGVLSGNGDKKLDFIKLRHRIYHPLAYPLLFVHGKDGWRCKLKHNAAKEKLQKVSPKKLYSCILYQRSCDFNIQLHSGRFFQHCLCEIFVKVEIGRPSWVRQNQTKLRASDYTTLLRC